MRQAGRRNISAAHEKRSWQFDPSICHDLYPETGPSGSRPPGRVMFLVSAELKESLEAFCAAAP
jgi:hypothetical protein